MARLAKLVVTETEVIRRALLAWLEFHGLDPKTMPVSNRIVRNVASCRIEFDQFQLGADGKPIRSEIEQTLDVMRVLHQGETPPLPWPAELLAVAR